MSARRSTAAEGAGRVRMDTGRTDTGGTRWHAAHVYYYDDHKDGLILDCIRPLFDRIAPEVDQRFFLRHWRQGPHVRLCVRTTGHAFHDVVRPEIDETVGDYLARHPSTVEVDENAMLEAHAVLSVQEREPGPLHPLHPDNCVRYEPYDDRSPVLGGEQAAQLLESFYHETSELAFDMLDHVRGGASRLTLGLDLMLATAHTQWPDIRYGFLSYRSHAESFIVAATDPRARRAALDRTYGSQAGPLRERLAAVLDELDTGRGTLPFIRSWAAVMDRFTQRAEPLIASGAVSFSAGDDHGGHRSWTGHMLEHSDFHRALQGDSEFATMREGHRFLGFRLMLNYLYLHLNRVGIRPFERFTLCHLAANTVEEHFGISADDLVARTSRPADPGTATGP